MTGPEDLQALAKALARLRAGCDGFLSRWGRQSLLATAKAYWEEMKTEQGKCAAGGSSARYAMVELVNLYDPALVFEPIHQALFGADPEARADLRRTAVRGMELVPCAPEEADLFLDDVPYAVGMPTIPWQWPSCSHFLTSGWQGIRNALWTIHGLDA